MCNKKEKQQKRSKNLDGQRGKIEQEKIRNSHRADHLARSETSRRRGNQQGNFPKRQKIPLHLQPFNSFSKKRGKIPKGGRAPLPEPAPRHQRLQRLRQLQRVRGR